MERRTADYAETGTLNVGVGSDGLPVIGGELPSEPEGGWSDANLVCAESLGRPRCNNFIAILTPADGMARGFGEMRQIRRFCTKLATSTELFEIDGNIYACGARSPRDPKSDEILRDFEDRQKDMTNESAEKAGELNF